MKILRIFLLVGTFGFFGCAKKSDEHVLSAFFYNDAPCLCLSFPKFDKNPAEMLFMLDTGSPDNVFYNEDIRLLSGSRADNAEYWAASGADVRTDGEGVSAIGFYGVKCGDFALPKLWISNFTHGKDPNINGLLGLDFMATFDVVVIDYARQKIVLDEPRVSLNTVPMTYNNDNAHIFLPAFIDGEAHDVMLDTGFSSDGEICLLVADDSSLPDYVSVKIGDLEWNDVYTLWWSEGTFGDQSVANDPKEYLDGIMIIGSAFFQDRRIQLDFKNMLFAAE